METLPRDSDRAALSNRRLPDIDRLSVLAAVIMLAFALGRVFTLPVWQSDWQILGISFGFQLDLGSLVLFVIGALTAAGTDWLLHDHPGRLLATSRQTVIFNIETSTLPHWLLPGLAAVAIGLALSQLPFTLLWWLGLAMGAIVLIAVLTAEYISLDASDARRPFAVLLLIATAFALYLVLMVNLSLTGLRLYLLLPLIFISSSLIGVRVFHLRLNGEWAVYEALIIAAIVTQFAAALHYWPISALQFGLFLLGATYGLVSLFVGLIEERIGRGLYLEAGLGLLIAILAGAIFR